MSSLLLTNFLPFHTLTWLLPFTLNSQLSGQQPSVKMYNVSTFSTICNISNPFELTTGHFTQFGLNLESAGKQRQQQSSSRSSVLSTAQHDLSQNAISQHPQDTASVPSQNRRLDPQQVKIGLPDCSVQYECLSQMSEAELSTRCYGPNRPTLNIYARVSFQIEYHNYLTLHYLFQVNTIT